jgi:peptidyl-prolyl cis-trans isomerase C
MKWPIRWSLALVVMMAAEVGLFAQAPPVPPQPKAPPPPAANLIAATVNGQSISELAVYRAAVAEERKNYDLLRKEILQHLIDNTLIEQYLVHLKINVDARDVEEKFGIIKAEADKKGGMEKVLKAHFVTEAEVRQELAAMLRWERFVLQQSTEQTLRDFFGKNKEMFDGSRVHARHILIKTDDKMTVEQATIRLRQLRKAIEEETQRELGKLPAEARTEKKAAELLVKAFADAAGKVSDCPSKESGGDLPYFLRAGMMVEAFARTAFALKSYQMSDVVVTQFGCHLILAVDRKGGAEVKFDDLRIVVREVYSDRLREAVIEAMKPNAKIVINTPAR